MVAGNGSAVGPHPNSQSGVGGKDTGGRAGSKTVAPMFSNAKAATAQFLVMKGEAVNWG